MSVPSLRPRGVLSRLLMFVMLVPSFAVGSVAARQVPGQSAPVVHVEGQGVIPAAVFQGSVRAGRFSTTTPGVMNIARSKHTMTLLADGRVLIAGYGAEIYDPDTRLFTPTGSPVTERSEHTATRLADGRVLIAGGRYGSPLQSAELYDPATGTFTTTGSLNQARAGHSALLLSDGRVLVVGGAPKPEIYNPTTATWATVPSGLPGGTQEIPGGNLYERPDGDIEIANTAGVFTLDLDTGNTRDRIGFNFSHLGGIVTRLDDGRVLVAGGSFSRVAELYDPTTRTVTTTGSMREPRHDASAIVLTDGRVLIAGGYEPVDKYGVFFRQAEIYDPTTGLFTSTGTMDMARRNAVPTLLNDGTVLLSGGNPTSGTRSTETAELYDPATGTFINLDRLAGNVLDHTASLLDDGRVLVAGGSFTNTAKLYDPATGWFTETATMVQKRSWHSAVTLLDGDVLVMGGQASFEGTYLASAELYDPATNTFSATGAMREARVNLTATVLPNGKVLVAGGTNASGTLATMELYDPATRTFQATATMSVPRADHTATLLPTGKVLLLGGTNDGTRQTSADLYDIGTGTITPTAPYPRPIAGHAAIRLEDGSVLVTGGRGNTNSTIAARYVPASGTFVATSPMNRSRTDHTSTRSEDGSVLVIGGLGYPTTGPVNAEVEVYDPAAGTFRIVGTLRQARTGHTATRLRDGSILVYGGSSNSSASVVRGELVRYDVTNTFTATLTVPNGWLTATSTVTATGTTTDAPLAAFAFGNGPFVNATANQPVVLPVQKYPEGKNLPVTLTMRDREGVTAPVLVATVDIDTTPPRVEVERPRMYSNATSRLSWGAYDGTSGVASYDVDIREEGGKWRPLLVATTATSITFTGTEGQQYIYRVRARDVAGNVGEWSQSVGTIIDTTAPEGTLRITAIGETTIAVATTATDNVSAVTSMRVAVGPQFDAAAWQPYAASTTIVRNAVPRDQIEVYAQWEDRAGNRSAVQCVRYDNTPCTAEVNHAVFLPLLRR